VKSGKSSTSRDSDKPSLPERLGWKARDEPKRVLRVQRVPKPELKSTPKVDIAVDGRVDMDTAVTTAIMQRGEMSAIVDTSRVFRYDYERRAEYHKKLMLDLSEMGAWLTADEKREMMRYANRTDFKTIIRLGFLHSQAMKRLQLGWQDRYKPKEMDQEEMMRTFKPWEDGEVETDDEDYEGTWVED
jgi:hypothetical protein